eukprot:3631442-Prymnesium_polylepis.1
MINAIAWAQRERAHARAPAAGRLAVALRSQRHKTQDTIAASNHHALIHARPGSVKGTPSPAWFVRPSHQPTHACVDRPACLSHLLKPPCPPTSASSRSCRWSA